MATQSDIASLLELGAGAGLGLSFFRAGFDRTFRSFDKRMKRLAVRLPVASNKAERERQTRFATMRTTYSVVKSASERYVPLFQAAALCGALANIFWLVHACLLPNEPLTYADGVVRVFWAVGYYATLLIIAEIYYTIELRQTRTALRAFEREMSPSTAA